MDEVGSGGEVMAEVSRSGGEGSGAYLFHSQRRSFGGWQHCQVLDRQLAAGGPFPSYRGPDTLFLRERLQSNSLRCTAQQQMDQRYQGRSLRYGISTISAGMGHGP